MAFRLPTFEYFQGPVEEMCDLCREPIECSFCGTVDTCFSTDTGIDESGEVIVRQCGCLDCLGAGKFEFWHDTEIGMLTETGLKKFYNHHVPPSPTFSQRAISSLRKTPQYLACQQEIWLVHCDDFMTYLGTWQPSDFVCQSADGDGRSLFLAMTDARLMGIDQLKPGKKNDLALAWDSVVSVDSPVPDDWGINYYAFRCRHCGLLRGHYDFD